MKKRIFEVIEVSKELPEKAGHYITRAHDGNHDETYFDGKEFGLVNPEGDMFPYKKWVITHWLKDAGERYVFTEKELIAFAKEFWDASEVFNKWAAKITETGERPNLYEILKSKGLTTKQTQHGEPTKREERN